MNIEQHSLWIKALTKVEKPGFFDQKTWIHWRAFTYGCVYENHRCNYALWFEMDTKANVSMSISNFFKLKRKNKYNLFKLKWSEWKRYSFFLEPTLFKDNLNKKGKKLEFTDPVTFIMLKYSKKNRRIPRQLGYLGLNYFYSNYQAYLHTYINLTKYQGWKFPNRLPRQAPVVNNANFTSFFITSFDSTLFMQPYLIWDALKEDEIVNSLLNFRWKNLYLYSLDLNYIRACMYNLYFYYYYLFIQNIQEYLKLSNNIVNTNNIINGVIYYNFMVKIYMYLHYNININYNKLFLLFINNLQINNNYIVLLNNKDKSLLFNKTTQIQINETNTFSSIFFNKIIINKTYNFIKFKFLNKSLWFKVFKLYSSFLDFFIKKNLYFDLFKTEITLKKQEKHKSDYFNKIVSLYIVNWYRNYMKSFITLKKKMKRLEKSFYNFIKIIKYNYRSLNKTNYFSLNSLKFNNNLKISGSFTGKYETVKGPLLFFKAAIKSFKLINHKYFNVGIKMVQPYLIYSNRDPFDKINEFIKHYFIHIVKLIKYNFGFSLFNSNIFLKGSDSFIWDYSIYLYYYIYILKNFYLDMFQGFAAVSTKYYGHVDNIKFFNYIFYKKYNLRINLKKLFYSYDDFLNQQTNAIKISNIEEIEILHKAQLLKEWEKF